MHLTFLGTGGGRWSAITQARNTGGFLLKVDGKKLHVDPGPGAISAYRQKHLDVRQLDGILCTHCHLDHFNDLPILIEGMCMGKKNAGLLIGSKTIIEGMGKFESPLHTYHQNLLNQIILAKDGETCVFGKQTLKFIGLKHEDPTTFGFRIGKRFGFISDTTYMDLTKPYKGVKTLLINLMRPNADRIKGHLCTEDVCLLAEKIKPKSIILQHFGLRMLRFGPNNQAKIIQDTTGIKTIAAEDGLELDLEANQQTLNMFEG
jgi:ribonuclease BN (tRNA processing enzyme)